MQLLNLNKFSFHLQSHPRYFGWAFKITCYPIITKLESELAANTLAILNGVRNALENYLEKVCYL